MRIVEDFVDVAVLLLSTEREDQDAIERPAHPPTAIEGSGDWNRTGRQTGVLVQCAPIQTSVVDIRGLEQDAWLTRRFR